MDDKEQKKENDEMVSIALKQLVESTEFKRPWMEEIKKFEDAYYGKEKETFRIQFDIPLPVLSGMVDELKDAFDDEIAMRISGTHPADALKVQKFQALFERETKSLRPNARWDYKTRADKFLAILSGRGIQKTFAESDPEFMLNFEIVDYRYFHCEPKGGGLLGKHLFQGEEGIFKTKSKLESGAKSGLYNKMAVKQMVAQGQNPDYKSDVESVYGEKLSRFASMGMDADNHNYVGEEIYHLCEWYLTYKGKKYYLLFDPYTRQVVRVAPLKEVFESGLVPYTSWATHEDPKVFWTKSYAKDFYVAHNSLRTLLSQEFTNRQKKNMTPKFYDAEVVDASRLDKSQYEHDAIVPINTKGGVRKIRDSVYQFDVPELGSATIDLSNWVSETFRKLTGTSEISDQANAKVGANVIYSKLQSASKRLSHRAKSFQEAYAEATLRAYHGCNEHLSEPVAIRIMGANMYGWDYISRDDFHLEGEIDPKVVSVSEEDEMNILGKDQKSKTLSEIANNPNLAQQLNPRKLVETMLKDAGGFKDDLVTELMDVNNFANMNIKNKAEVAILQLCKGKMPEMVFDADAGFVERIMQFEKEHRNQLDKKLELNDQGEIKIFYEYLSQHMVIVAGNMGRLANQIKNDRKIAGNPQDPNAGGGAPQPAGGPVPATPQVQLSSSGGAPQPPVPMVT